jgi:uncharacterized protein YbbK (DUF523 family)/RimJ/RimL family protein N-acetyltransferase
VKIAVSACLLDMPCRYDGSSRPDRRVMDLASKHELVPICPEQLGGFEIPHLPSEVDMSVRFPRVISEDGIEVTDVFESGARRTLELLREEGVRLAILKERSPSCGTDYIYDGTFTHTLVPGSGITTRLLRSSGIRVIGESQLDSCTAAIFATCASETPSLATERFTLRPLDRSGAELVFESSRAMEMTPSVGEMPPRSVDESHVFIERIASNPHVFGLVEKRTGQVVGSIGLIPDERRANTDVLSLGYFLGRQWWGRGYMTEATREVVRYGFEDLRLSLISASHYVFNQRSKRVLENCGFTCEGVFRGAEATPDGIMQDIVSYSMSKEEYFSQGRIAHAPSDDE